MVSVSRLLSLGPAHEGAVQLSREVGAMLALEGEFDIEFPDAMLKRNVFGSIAAISAAVSELQAA